MIERSHPDNQTESEKQPSTLTEIRELADQIVFKMHEQTPEVALQMQEAWQECATQLTFDGEAWVGPKGCLLEVYKKVLAAVQLLQLPQVYQLTDLLDSRKTIHPDWISLAAFLQHDMYHTSPFEVMHFYVDIEAYLTKIGKTTLLPRQKEFLDQAFSSAQALALQFAFPIEFVATLTDILEKKPIKTNPIHLKEFFQTMITLIAGRTSADDYNIVVNGTSDPKRNNLILTVHEDLTVEMNQSMLFGIVYNLVKNAAKANRKKHYELNDPYLGAVYRGETVKHPMNVEIKVEELDQWIQILVIDHGQGISIDQALKRFQEQLQKRLEQEGESSVLNSEWCYTIRRALGDSQANYLFGWPKDPFLIRKVDVGSIWDLHFVSGFDSDDWDTRSISSGLGLWGVRYIIEYLKGSVAGTNHFEKGAVFSVQIPKQQTEPQTTLTT